MKRKGLLIALVLMVVFIGTFSCKLAYRESTLTGTISGETFTFVDGYIDTDGDFYMYNTSKDFSSWFSYITTYPYIMGSFGAVEVGEKVLKFDRDDWVNAYTIIGVTADGPSLIYTEGNIEITSVTTTTVEGRLHIKTHSDDLNGVFTLERVSW